MKLKLYETLKEEVLNCQNCDLGCEKQNDLDPHVMGQGNLDSKIFVVAEAPGKNEVLYKRPLTPPGASGKIYEKVLSHWGFNARSSLYYQYSAL